MGRFSSFVDQIFNMKLFLAIAVACLVPAIKADATCEDCITFGTAMQGYLMSADSIAEQTELLVAILCPQAQDQAECDAAIRKYWEGIALAMYPVFLDANDVCAQLGVCKKNAKLAEIMDFLKGDAYCGSLGDADC